MWKQCIFRVVVRGLVLMFGLVLSAPAGAEVLFSDDFAYADRTNLNGIGGWTATDATAHWVLNDDGLGDGGTNSLQYPGITSQDGRLYVKAGSNNIYHALSRPVTGEGNSLYASFLYKPLSIPGTYWFQLDTTGSIQGQLGRIDGKNTNGQVELGCRMRTATVLSKKPIPLGQTALVVMKVTMVPGSNNDTVQLWVNPPVGAPEPAADATAIAETGNDINPATGIIGFSFRVGQSNSGEKEVDLMRLGTTWEDVTSHPYLAAGGPSPGNGAEDIARDAVLSWSPGQLARTHDVYFGTVLADVNAAGRTSPKDVLVSQGQDAATYVPGLLALGQTYYWRVDEVNVPSITKGSVWSFTVEPYAYPITNVTATASSSQADMGPEKTIDGAGLNADDQHSTDVKQMWFSKGTLPNWIQFEFDKLYRLDELWIWNYNQPNENIIGFGAKDVAIEYSADGSTWTPLGGVPVFTRASGSTNYVHDTIVDFGGAPAKYVKLTINSTWGGMAQAGLSEVRFFYVPVQAREPQPAIDATGQELDVTLNWRPGREAALHKVYLSSDPNAVANGTASANTVSTHSFDPTGLNLATTYYWRVDEVNDAARPGVWTGDVWSFSTHEYLVVDDFESCTNDSPKRVFQTWIDGMGFSEDEFFPKGNPGNGTGAMVGYDPTAGNIMETATVHGGTQSMPVSYDSSVAATSEAERTFTDPQDWTGHGIKALMLWFCGNATNTASQMYVKVNGRKVAYDGDATNLLRKPWHLWYISLSQFSGVDLSKVTKLAIGFEGGKGLVFVDDIRLSSQDRQSVTPVKPDTANLLIHYALEGNTNSSAGTLHATAGGTPTYVPGKVGQAIKLNGATDYLMVEGSFTLAEYSAAMWFNVEGGTGTRDLVSIYSGSSHGVLLEITDTGAFRFLHRVPLGTSGGNDMRSNSNYADGEWYHMAAVKSATAIRLYINGEQAATAADSTEFAEVLPRLTIGVLRHDSLSRFFPGTIDEFYLYNRTLQQAEIAYLAGLTKPLDK